MSNQSQVELHVTSHVGRDLLQSAELFKHDRLVVWEYVSNGLQYVDKGTPPEVRVQLHPKKKKITISDNGQGMDLAGLKNYFIMHGENVDRKAGKAGRGRFGTGKSAAFGIADTLRITTVRNGKRSKVILTRAMIKAPEASTSIPLQVIEAEVPTEEPNGTLVEIEGIHLNKLDRPGIIKFLERHLAKWRGNVTVFVNHHECEYHEPQTYRVERFRPTGQLAERLGEVELLVKVATSPLDQETRGIDVLSNGAWHECTLGSEDGKEMSEYLFGEIDVPALDSDDSPISPFDQSRSMQLNLNNPTVRAIHAFISQTLEAVRKELVAAERERKRSEEAKRLQETGDKIAEILNQDFAQYRQKLSKARARAQGGADGGQTGQGDDALDDLLLGTELPGVLDDEAGDPGYTGEGSRDGDGAPPVNPAVREAERDEEKRAKRAGGEGKKPRGRGGFSVRFENMGPDIFRAKYVGERRTIYVNLDHPQVKAALGKGRIEDLSFKRLSYEVALSEYAIAVHMELAANGQYGDDVTDPIYDIQETIDRISRQTAPIYEGMP